MSKHKLVTLTWKRSIFHLYIDNVQGIMFFNFEFNYCYLEHCHLTLGSLPESMQINNYNYAMSNTYLPNYEVLPFLFNFSLFFLHLYYNDLSHNPYCVKYLDINYSSCWYCLHLSGTSIFVLYKSLSWKHMYLTNCIDIYYFFDLICKYVNIFKTNTVYFLCCYLVVSEKGSIW